MSLPCSSSPADRRPGAGFRPRLRLRYRVRVRPISFLLLLLPLGCGEPFAPAEDPGRGVLLIAIDALRYDHTGFAGYDRDTTPKLSALFDRQGVVFEDAWSPGPGLLPSHISLLTGCDPTIASRPEVVLSDGRKQAPLVNWSVPDGAPSLADEFLGAGWHTAAFVDHSLLEGRRGVDRGFRDFQEVGPWSENAQYLSGVGSRFFEWLSGIDGGDDWFAYVHFNDLEALWSERWGRQAPNLDLRFEVRPELDQAPPVSVRSPAFFALPADRILEGSPSLGVYEATYDSALWWLDSNLRRLISMVGERGGLADTTIVLTGTFGVSFGESGLLVDSGLLSPVDLHVPLLLRPAQGLGVRAEQRIDQLVSLADIAPTLLALNGIEVPRGMHGENLAPLLRGKGELERDTLFASHGVLDGFTVITEEDQYAWWQPGSRGAGSVMSYSWYGRGSKRDGKGVRFLAARELPARDWLSTELEGESARALELHERGLAWYADLERARQVLHPNPWNEQDRTPEVVEELVERGLIGDAP